MSDVKRYYDYGGLVDCETNQLVDAQGRALVFASDYAALSAQVRELREEIHKLQVENGGLKIALNDLKGNLAGKVCAMCNYLQRSECYRQRSAIETALKNLMQYTPRQKWVGGVENGHYEPTGAALLAVLDECDRALKP